MTTQSPTTTEQDELEIRSYRGIDLGLGQADPVADVAAKLEAAHPGHLVLVQAGKFLHGYDRTAYALATLKNYKLKLVGTAEAPHLRVGFPAGNFKRRLWSMVADFGIPYVVALGTLASGRTVFVSDQPAGNGQVLAAVSDQIVAQVIEDLRQRNEVNKAAARELLTHPDTAGFKLKSQAHPAVGPHPAHRRRQPGRVPRRDRPDRLRRVVRHAYPGPRLRPRRHQDDGLPPGHARQDPRAPRRHRRQEELRPHPRVRPHRLG
jgi:hypothetical protein